MVSIGHTQEHIEPWVRGEEEGKGKSKYARHMPQTLAFPWGKPKPDVVLQNLSTNRSFFMCPGSDPTPPPFGGGCKLRFDCWVRELFLIINF
jgi:hypothetical protein